MRWHQLGQHGGVLAACPCPEQQALDPAEVEEATTRALRDAAAQGVAGKPLTPWLLAAVTETLGPRTITANHALLLNNARIGARLASALRQLSTTRDH
jgi:pseudouridine-5'-phosphate glycosidase